MVKRIKVVAAIIMLTIMMGNEAFANDLLKESEDIPEVYNGVNGTNEEKEDSFEVLLDKQYSIEQFEQTVTNLYPGVVLSAVEEIMLIHIELPESVEKEEFLNNKEIREFIYAQGELPDISIPLNPLGTVSLNKLNVDVLKNLRARMTDEEMFDAMAWHVDEITNNRKSLDITKGKGVKIALIDSGVDISHPVLAGKINMQDSYSYVTNEPSIRDDNGHGTGVAGVIAQIAPESVITVYKVIGEETGESDWTISAIIQAANNGNDIINMSLGTYKCDDVESELLTIEAYERAVQYAEEKECLVVASAGNKALDLDQYYENEGVKHLPGGIEAAITISSVHKNSLATYSNFGSNIDFSAPGGDLAYVDGLLDLNQWIYILYPTTLDNGLSSLGVPQGYTFNCGTSLSAPAVTAGIADLLSYSLENKQDLNMKQIVEVLIEGANDIGTPGKDNCFGYGVANIYNSIVGMK